jgi:hypothetical protein
MVTCYRAVTPGRSPRAFLIAVLLAIPAIAQAQPAPAPPAAAASRQSKIFVDVSLLGVADSLAHARALTLPFVVFGENATIGASYSEPGRAKGWPIDLGGGFMLKRSLGLAATLSRTKHEHVVGLSATIPHPLFFNRPASATGTRDGALAAREQALHLSVAFVPIRRDRAEWRVAGGPSFFSYSAEMVESVLYQQDYFEVTPSNVIAIVGAASRDTRGSGKGFHVGSDFTWFLNHLVGVGVGARYSRGAVTLDEPLSQLSQQFRVGNRFVYVGVRLRVDNVLSR